jgi:hypothetical protein
MLNYMIRFSWHLSMSFLTYGISDITGIYSNSQVPQDGFFVFSIEKNEYENIFSMFLDTKKKFNH